MFVFVLCVQTEGERASRLWTATSPLVCLLSPENFNHIPSFAETSADLPLKSLTLKRFSGDKLMGSGGGGGWYLAMDVNAKEGNSALKCVDGTVGGH